MMNFSGVVPENWMQSAGKLYEPRPLKLKTRAELLASIRPSFWKYLKKDTGDVPVAPAVLSALAAKSVDTTVVRDSPLGQ
jgi:hypothetical protein